MSNVLALSGMGWFLVVDLAALAGALVYFKVREMLMTPEQRQAQREKIEANKQAEAERLARNAAYKQSGAGKQPGPVFDGYHGYQNAPTRKDIQKPVVVKTLPRMTAPYVRRRLIEDMAANGYAATNMVRTTTGKTIITFTRPG